MSEPGKIVDGFGSSEAVMSSESVIAPNSEVVAAESEIVEIDMQIAETDRKLKKLSKIGKIIKNLIIGSVLVPFCAAMVVGLYRNIESVSLQVRASENVEMGGEFDPTMGESISTENGRALVVVHEGYGMEVFPAKYKDNQEYQEYLRKVEAEKELYYANGDPVVIVVTDLAVIKGLVKLEPHPNTLYYVTQPNNGFGAMSFTSDGVLYRQPLAEDFFDMQGVGPWKLLKGIGVTEVEMAGEFRGACPSQVAAGIEEVGLKIGWSDLAAFPIITNPKQLEAYPTLEPLP